LEHCLIEPRASLTVRGMAVFDGDAFREIEGIV
jgi:hypothetical protein